MNTVLISGRLTRPAELKRTNTGKAVTSFTVAVEGEFDYNKTNFVNCVAWEKTAEFVSKHFDKGQTIIIKGELVSREYEKDGDKRTAWEVKVDKAYFAGEKAKDDWTVDAGNAEEAEELPF